MLTASWSTPRRLSVHGRLFARQQWPVLSPHLTLTTLGPGGAYELHLDPSPISFSGQAIGQVLGRIPGALYWALSPLDNLTFTHRVLTSAAAPDVHDAFHEDLLEEAGELNGLQKDLMSDRVYRQALIRLGLPVLQRNTYATQARPVARVALCRVPEEVRALVERLHAACEAASAHAGEPCLSYAGVLVTHPEDRLQGLMHELTAAQELQHVLDDEEVRSFGARQRAGKRVWALLDDLEALCRRFR